MEEGIQPRRSREGVSPVARQRLVGGWNDDIGMKRIRALDTPPARSMTMGRVGGCDASYSACAEYDDGRRGLPASLLHIATILPADFKQSGGDLAE